MNNKFKTLIGTTAVAGALALSLAACGSKIEVSQSTTAQTTAAAETTSSGIVTLDSVTTAAESQAQESTSSGQQTAQSTEAVTATANVTSTGAIDATDLFSSRDLEQTADLSEAQYITVSDGQTVEITGAGVYVISGTASNAQIIVNADKDNDKVQLVLDGLNVTNDSTPVIYVKSADKVFITTAEGSENNLSVTGSFTSDGDTNTDAVIFSKDDLVLNGLGTLNITSTDNGISGHDDLKITGGTINITCTSDAIEANDSIRISGGDITINTRKDGLHAENDDDYTLGYIYICGGTLDITASDDAIHATTIFQMDDGELTLSAAEGIEATYVQINGGTIYISASDDGINAGRKSNAYTVQIEINGGYITIVMGQGDTDGIDSNGNLYINGGTVDVTANSPFDYDGTAQYNGGTIIVNGEETNTITNQMMGGGGMGGFGGGGMGGFGGFGGGGRR